MSLAPKVFEAVAMHDKFTASGDNFCFEFNGLDDFYGGQVAMFITISLLVRAPSTSARRDMLQRTQ